MARLAPVDPATAVRPLVPSDTGFCRALFDADRGPRFAALGDDALVRTLLDQQFRAQQAAYAGSFPAAEHGVIAHGGAPAGRLIVAVSGPAVHLVDIVLAETARGHGIGTDVIEALARVARAHGFSRMTLSVAAENAPARRLYARLGFAGTPAGSHIAMVRSLT
ncbi:GNAT family N-acetyltransferase [Rhodoplanes sp. TEM]|uniref:GNAT family N-acetyltransferase n=1 Tax=Rhodoplanes tepidamans TaxID=200616 RepID=A0ABT5JCY4_RHOTP|nr:MULTISPECIES: GNAT family N-acetyltransferase [Rhodoplanes]MDC7787482.1 GNAT family N-acetyltransferase [Rhodoplanes tepidamans]MDC7983927.1 GNAT family N-acetyltransferase [Rhodoplanes sp. TEM]MDQ0354366.1 ribosomal protein S18 acetylase RimI-like enzyme [Rhodoplanes tepidamans]